jgi:hypothetical protein
MRYNFRDADTCVYCKFCLYNHVAVYYTEYFCNLDKSAPVNSSRRLDLGKFKYHRDVNKWRSAHWVEATDVCDEFVKEY